MDDKAFRTIGESYSKTECDNKFQEKIDNQININAKGYCKIGTLIIQVGEITLADGSTGTCNFNTPFSGPTSYQIAATQFGNAGGDQYRNGWCITNKTQNSFGVQNSTNQTNTFCWIAIGI